MLKFLLMVGLAWAVWWWWRKQQAARQAGASRPERAAEAIVRCAACGVHVPASEALVQEGRAYCCPAHREQDAEPRR